MASDEAFAVDTLIEENRNKTSVKCVHCSSLMLKPASADYVKSEFGLPEPRQKKDAGTGNKDFSREQLQDFWVVKDMYTFENIGFSNTVDNQKFLICADCEIGPVGYHDLDTKLSYVALRRVKHE